MGNSVLPCESGYPQNFHRGLGEPVVEWESGIGDSGLSPHPLVWVTEARLGREEG